MIWLRLRNPSSLRSHGKLDLESVNNYEVFICRVKTIYDWAAAIITLQFVEVPCLLTNAIHLLLKDNLMLNS
jgi:hypothetical protein